MLRLEADLFAPAGLASAIPCGYPRSKTPEMSCGGRTRKLAQLKTCRAILDYRSIHVRDERLRDRG